MNRRSFIGGLLASGAAFSILPGAGRLWRPSRAYEVEYVYPDLGIYEQLRRASSTPPKDRLALDDLLDACHKIKKRRAQEHRGSNVIEIWCHPSEVNKMFYASQ